MPPSRRSPLELLHDLVDHDFACKVRRRMRRDRNPLLVTVQDKYTLREYAAARGVRTARLLHAVDRADDLPLEGLPPDCFLKANNACGRNILRAGGRFYLFGDGAELLDRDGALEPDRAAPRLLSTEECLARCRGWLEAPYRAEEWAYQQMAPKLLVEELLTPRTGGELKDLRFYAFDGVTRAINVGSPTYRRRGENVFLDPSWTPISLTRRAPLPDPLPERPPCLPEMLDAASRLSRGLDFVRVDLYDTRDGVVLGEMTVYPEAGQPGTPTPCPRFNRWLGAQWKRPARKLRS